jgi:hypothetical protein
MSNTQKTPADAGPFERRVMAPVSERTTFADWLRAAKGRLDDRGDVNYHWTENTTMGEHDAALMAWRFQQARIDLLREFAQWLKDAYHDEDGMPQAGAIERRAWAVLEETK